MEVAACYSKQILNGVMLGMVYALIAVGYSLVFGILRLLNMAHGSIFAFERIGPVRGGHAVGYAGGICILDSDDRSAGYGDGPCDPGAASGEKRAQYYLPQSHVGVSLYYTRTC